MDKIFIRTLWGSNADPLWRNDAEREALRRYLNAIGFYVLSGDGDWLEVHAIDYSDPMDIRIAKKFFDKIGKVWYTLIRRKEATK